jgi:hypothetical protein
MRLGMRMGLNSRQLGGTRLDPDAKLYIATVQAALGATTIEAALPNATNPKKIISDFYKAEKDAGRYSLHKRIFLPIYNNLAANAVDAVTTTSGTYPISGVNVFAGYAQSNGTGYFDTVTLWQSLVTLESATIGTLNYTTNPTANMVSMGIGSTVGTSISVGSENSSQIARAAWAGASATLPANATLFTSGIQIASRFGGVTRMTRRSSSGIVEATNSGATTGIVVDGSIFMMARNTAGSPTLISTAQIGAGFISSGMGSTDLAGYSLNLKTLWENLTGLTLP